MTKSIRDLEPKAVWNYFSDLNAVPRPSKKEERIIQFILDFGKQLNLPINRDEVGNVIIKKPASKGMESRQTVILQSHLDMVHQKNADTVFDFDTQGIDMYLDGDWVKAKGTTLGADNGLGVASIMAILASDSIVHPPIEALFTIDEETGMTGALNLKGGLLDGRILLNLDTEDDRELTIGCAGGVDVTATGSYSLESAPEGVVFYELSVKGATGGHSGMDIYLGRANANKLMNRLLTAAFDTCAIQIASIDGGSLRNAIPRESLALVMVPESNAKELENLVLDKQSIFQAEYQTTDPQLVLSCKKSDAKARVLQKGFQSKLLKSISACLNGIYRMSPDILHLVQTSNNLARVSVKDGEYSIQCLTRSSVDSEKIDLAESLKSAFELMGAKVSFAGSYPGWTPNPHATIVQLMRNLYTKMHQSEPLVSACHAGLECGILGTNYPGMEMISFGPNITGAHSPDEKVQVSSVQKYWQLLLETLKQIPEKK